MFCQKCGAELAQESIFCSKCDSNSNGSDAEVFLPVSMEIRFLNYILDSIFYLILCVFVGFWIGFFSGFLSVLFKIKEVNFDSIWFSVLAFLLYPLYYVFFEGIWQSTPGKWITKTKVTRIDGTKPRFLQILGRTFSRYIPFDNFSFLFNNTPRGWHDRISKTLVVPASYTIDDVKKIDVKKIKNNGNKIVVIIVAIFAIIFIFGILSAVVLTSINQTIEKAQIKMDESKIETPIVNTNLE